MIADALAGDRTSCLATGMDDCISKPVLHEDLHAALHRVQIRPPSAPDEGPLNIAELERLRNDLGASFSEELSQLVELYRTQQREDIGSVRAALAAHDLVGIAKLAHRLRGSGEALGAQRAVALCKDLEYKKLAAAEQGALIDRLEAEIAQAIGALELLSCAQIAR